MELSERIAYLKGLLAAGRGEAGQGEAQDVLAGVLDVLGDVVARLDSAVDAQARFRGQIRDLASDVSDLADELTDRDRAVGQWEVECPSCGCSFAVPDEDLIGEDVQLVCPECGAVIHDLDPELEVDEDDDTLEDRE